MLVEMGVEGTCPEPEPHTTTRDIQKILRENKREDDLNEVLPVQLADRRKIGLKGG